MKKGAKVFLDDIRIPADCGLYMKVGLEEYVQEGWLIVRNYEEFVQRLTSLYQNNDWPELISFDHDLGDEFHPVETLNDPERIIKEQSGYECAKWLVEFCIEKGLPLPHIYIHTMNPIGRANISGYFESYIKSLKI